MLLLIQITLTKRCRLQKIRGHPLSTYAKFSEKLTFLTHWYTHILVPIRGLEKLIFRKILRTYLIDGPLSKVSECVKASPRLISSVFTLTVVHFRGELHPVGLVGWQKVRLGPKRTRKSLISICCFNCVFATLD